MHSTARSPAAACVAVGVPCHLHLLYLCYSSVLHVCNIVSIPLFLSNIARVQGVGCGVSPNLDVSQEDALADLHARNVELERLGYLLAAAHHLHLGGPQKNRTSHRKTKTGQATGKQKQHPHRKTGQATGKQKQHPHRGTGGRLSGSGRGVGVSVLGAMAVRRAFFLSVFWLNGNPTFGQSSGDGLRESSTRHYK